MIHVTFNPAVPSGPRRRVDCLTCYSTYCNGFDSNYSCVVNGNRSVFFMLCMVPWSPQLSNTMQADINIVQHVLILFPWVLHHLVHVVREGGGRSLAMFTARPLYTHKLAVLQFVLHVLSSNLSSLSVVLLDEVAVDLRVVGVYHLCWRVLRVKRRMCRGVVHIHQALEHFHTVVHPPQIESSCSFFHACTLVAHALPRLNQLPQCAHHGFYGCQRRG